MQSNEIFKLINDEINMFSKLEYINNLQINKGCVDGKIIGTGRSDYTQESTMYNLLVGNKNVILIDIPGIEGDESNYEQIISSSLDKAHIIFYVNGSGKK